MTYKWMKLPHGEARKGGRITGTTSTFTGIYYSSKCLVERGVSPGALCFPCDERVCPGSCSVVFTKRQKSNAIKGQRKIQWIFRENWGCNASSSSCEHSQMNLHYSASLLHPAPKPLLSVSGSAGDCWHLQLWKVQNHGHKSQGQRWEQDYGVPGYWDRQPFSLEGQMVFPLCCLFPCKNDIILLVPKKTLEEEISVRMPVVQRSLMINFKYGWGKSQDRICCLFTVGYCWWARISQACALLFFSGHFWTQYPPVHPSVGLPGWKPVKSPGEVRRKRATCPEGKKTTLENTDANRRLKTLSTVKWKQPGRKGRRRRRRAWGPAVGCSWEVADQGRAVGSGARTRVRAKEGDGRRSRVKQRGGLNLQRLLRVC